MKAKVNISANLNSDSSAWSSIQIKAILQLECKKSNNERKSGEINASSYCTISITGEKVE